MVKRIFHNKKLNAKEKMKKLYLLITLVILLLLIPFILNFLISQPTFFNVVGEPVDWLHFWATYLGAAASFLMIAFTALALKHNKEQLEELKRQWQEEHKPNISLTFNQLGNVAYLRVVNTSIVEIRDLKISGDFYVEGRKNTLFDMNVLEQFDIDIEPHGIRNIVLHNNIVPLTQNCYFILHITYNGENKTQKIYCNNYYSVGDILVWKQLADEIKKS